MTATDRLERDLPRLLEELYLGPMPSYRDDVLGRIAATAQRPGWIPRGRWFDVAVFTEPVVAPRLSWRTIAVLALLALALLAAARLVGSHERRLPEPFGPAGNGLIAYAHGKDIYVGDPTTGTTTAIVTGPAEDTRPAFSPDGSRIAFLRRHSLADSLGASDIVTVRPDGSELRILTSERTYYDFVWTSDSASVVTADRVGRLVAFDAAGMADPRMLGTDVAVSFGLGEPNGDRWLSVDHGEGWARLAVRNANGSVATVLVDRSAGFAFVDIGPTAWSPDASRIAFIGGITATPCRPSPLDCYEARLHVVNADGSGLRQLSRAVAAPGSGTVIAEGPPAWSPDGTRIAVARRTVTPTDGERATIGDVGCCDEIHQLIVVDARTGTEREIALGDDFLIRGGAEPSPWSWSPDGQSLLVRGASGSLFIVDSRTGRKQPLSWDSQDAPTWQRLAGG